MTVDTFTTVVNQLLPEPHAGLLNGILFGIKAQIPKDLYSALVATGTLHIVALSGMNISILESLIANMLGPLFNKRVTSLLTMFLITGFVLFVGPSPSVIRAAIMGSIALLAVVFGRQRWGIYSLLLTAGIMLIIRIQWIGDLSFQLSFLATLGIMLFAGKPTGNILRDTFTTTMAAQVFTTPLIFFTFRRISIISPLTNVLIGWIIQPLTAVGLVLTILGWVWLPLGYLVSWLTWGMLEYVVVIIEVTARIPMSYIAF